MNVSASNNALQTRNRLILKSQKPMALDPFWPALQSFILRTYIWPGATETLVHQFGKIERGCAELNFLFRGLYRGIDLSPLFGQLIVSVLGTIPVRKLQV
jgi:hypothetical protein